MQDNEKKPALRFNDFSALAIYASSFFFNKGIYIKNAGFIFCVKATIQDYRSAFLA